MPTAAPLMQCITLLKAWWQKSDECNRRIFVVKSLTPMKRGLLKAGCPRAADLFSNMLNVRRGRQNVTVDLCFGRTSRKSIYYLSNGSPFMFLPPLFPRPKLHVVILLLLLSQDAFTVATVLCGSAISIKTGWAKQLYSLSFKFITASHSNFIAPFSGLPLTTLASVGPLFCLMDYKQVSSCWVYFCLFLNSLILTGSVSMFSYLWKLSHWMTAEFDLLSSAIISTTCSTISFTFLLWK